VEVELYPLLSTIILVTTIVTIIFAFFSYLAFRARAKGAAKRGVGTGDAAARPQLFKRYEPTA